jgi:lipopolysaccharide/colanic/teichoic acid biosynthesis glycosyltransferase
LGKKPSCSSNIRYPFHPKDVFGKNISITGWAQVKGEYAGSVEGQLRKLEYDIFYIQNRSMFFDLFILLKTVQTILFRAGE